MSWAAKKPTNPDSIYDSQNDHFQKLLKNETVDLMFVECQSSKSEFSFQTERLYF